MENDKITITKLTNAIEVLVWYTGYLEDIIRTKNNVYSFNNAIEDVIKTVTDFFHISKEDLKGNKRTADTVLPRKVAMYLIRQNTTYSLAEIGRIFNRDHSTVLASIQSINDMLSYDYSFRVLFDLIRHQVKMKVGDGGQEVPNNIHSFSKAQ